MDTFVKDKLTEWNFSDLIKTFEDEGIDKECFLGLDEKEITTLIPKMGPRKKFKIRLKELLESKTCTYSTEPYIPTTQLNIPQTAAETQTRLKATIKPIKKLLQTLKTERSPGKPPGVAKGDMPPFLSSSAGVADLNKPSTSEIPPQVNIQGKRTLDEANANKQCSQTKGTNKRHCGSPLGNAAKSDVTIKKQVEEIMEHIKDKLDTLPSTKILHFLKEKIKVLETDKKEIVGVFGRTGAGKSSLINAILGEPDLLPSGGDGSACTSVMLKVEANTTNPRYIAEIEFISEEEWKEELLSIIEESKQKNDNDKEEDNNHEDDYDDDKISALYGEGVHLDLEELMDRKHFREIPEFRSSEKKIISCDTASKLSTKIARYTRSDKEGDNKSGGNYWPLVKCVTLKIPNSKDLLENVALVDLPGTGDCNKSRDQMWKSFVGNCSAVWIVNDITRVTSEKDPWEILDNTVSRMGPGGECRSISFICTKTDNDTRSDGNRVLSRNNNVKKQVREKFNKQKEIKKHFSDEKDFFQVFTVSSNEFQKKTFLQPEQTEIPKLQEFLRNLNDRQRKTADYVSGAYGILSLIQGANSSDKTVGKEEVYQVLEQKLNDELETISKSMDELHDAFERCLSKGVEQSVESCETSLNKVTTPRGQKGSGFHKTLKSLCENDGVYKPKGKKKRKEINLNESLTSCVRGSIDEVFKKYFPNQGKRGPIRECIDNFNLDTSSLVKKETELSLHLTFLKTEEIKLKAELHDDILKKKKEIYYSLTESVKRAMLPCYIRAARHKGKDSLKRMRNELNEHMKKSKSTMFLQAKDKMLDLIKNLKEHMLMNLKCKLQGSIEVSRETFYSSSLPDVTEEYDKIHLMKTYQELRGNNITATACFDSQSEKSAASDLQSKKGMKHAQVQKSVTVLIPHIVKSTPDHRPHYRLDLPEAGHFQCRFTGLVFVMEAKGEVFYNIVNWDRSLLGQKPPAGPLFSIKCDQKSIRQLHFPHCEISHVENPGNLSVAHITDGNLEVLPPLKMTDQHVIVNITDLSLFGLIRNWFTFLPVQSQVLLFLRKLGDLKCILNVLLLPRNVPLSEVSHQQSGSTYIQTSSQCTLNPKGRYGLCCELISKSEIQPRSGQFDEEYSPNFHPTFQVFLDSVPERVRLILLDRGNNDQRVWEGLVQLAGYEAPQIILFPVSDGFLDKHWNALIQRVTMVLPIADDLLLEDIIPDELYSKICIPRTSQEQMRELMNFVRQGGPLVKSAFLTALQKYERHLVIDLKTTASS